MGTSVRLPARLERLISRVAKERGATKSEVIRNVLTVLEKEDQKVRRGATPYQAMKHLIGCASGGPSDLSTETGKKFRGVLLRRRTAR
jgi:Arc/MetJ-type ribon-helix-helix transcriptional regulator